MTDALALLISGREFWIGFWAGGTIVGFVVLAICRARFVKYYDAGWLAHDRYRAAQGEPRVHNW